MSETSDHDKIEAIAEARVFALAAPVVLPLLEKRKKEALGRLLIAYRSGKTELTTIVAEISALTDLELEITRKESTFRQLEEANAGR